ncbi:restriction endonuclease [Lentilactobacillus curieae]|uniref:Type-2 restriction enzyme n=2 Tax=Lentilactobacillus curieae TaxID=1138822 RepID=A0A1S6QH68_9LACO|nr:restriction endonuclease [Lentilactobacillus curieae]
MDFAEYMGMSPVNKFQYFMKTRLTTNRTPSYWVKWENANKHIASYEVSLNTLNYLVGKENIAEEARKLFLEQPNLIKTIPLLIASRDMTLDVLIVDADNEMSHSLIDFLNPDISKIDLYLNFMKDSGLLNFLEKELNESLVDYVLGVQVGLDSNGRKNRSGQQNERILATLLERVVSGDESLHYLLQPTQVQMFNQWGILVPEVTPSKNKGGRRYDGAIYNDLTETVTIIETNFYGSGGSKLKAVAGEFSDLYSVNFKNAKNVNFVWISDGPGWDTAKNPMEEAFAIIPNIINVTMAKNGYLSELVEK